MTDFDKHKLDGRAFDQLERRKAIGRECIEAAADHSIEPDDEDFETYAKDAISDILTAVIGAAGLSIAEKTDGPHHGDGIRYRLVHDANRIAAAEELLDGALRSWEGDAEDYDTELPADETPEPMPVVIVVRDPDSSNEYAVLPQDATVETYDIDLGHMDLSDPDEFADWKASHLGSAAGFRSVGRTDVADYIEATVANVADNYGHDMVLPEVERELPEELP